MKKILLSSPIRNRERTLPTLLGSILRLKYSKSLLGLFFLLNDSEDKSKDLLEQFREEYLSAFRYIEIEEVKLNTPPDVRARSLPPAIQQKGFQRSKVFQALGKIRNMILERFIKDEEAEFLFSVDSDMKLAENVLGVLIETGKDIITFPVYYDYDKRQLLNLQYEGGRRVLSQELSEKREPFKVKYLDGCWMISKKVALSGVKFPETPSPEQLEFSKELKKKGFEIWAYPEILAEHLMTNNWKEYPSLRALA
jgi:cellulose synthase/poly-beta-1,6-N-acetylglucosamine synthase-like glycosyltransferase